MNSSSISHTPVISLEQARTESVLAQAKTEPPPLSFVRSVLSAQELESLEILPRECLVGTWWKEGGQGFLFGPRGLGKTWLSVYLARCLAEGRDCGPWKISKARRVLYVDGEMALDGLRERDRALRKTNDAPLNFLSHQHHFDVTGRGLNLTDLTAQAAVLSACEHHRVEVVFLDNLSCLFSGMRENDADDWEAVLPWLLTLRRKGIAVCIVHHSGRAGSHMRGTSKREDASTWVMGLAAPSAADTTPGARFVGRFTKNREGDQSELGPWQWTFRTDATGTHVTHEKMDALEMFVQLVRDGLSSCSEIAEEMGVSKGTVSKWAKRAHDAGQIQIINKEYRPTE